MYPKIQNGDIFIYVITVILIFMKKIVKGVLFHFFLLTFVFGQNNKMLFSKTSFRLVYQVLCCLRCGIYNYFKHLGYKLNKIAF